MNITNLRVSASCQIPGLREIYSELLPDDGFFIEIGAFDGESLSNTSGLADLGWAGIYVEPVAEFAVKCIARHQKNKRVSVYNLGVSDSNCELPINIGDALSTASQASVVAYSEISWASHIKFNRKQICTFVTLDTLIEIAKVDRSIDLLVVDVEGFESKVFGGFSLEKFKPKVIIVELCDAHPSFSGSPMLQNDARGVRQYLIKAGYEQVFSDEINTIFVRY